MKKRILSILLTLCMLIGMLPVSALAAEGSNVVKVSSADSLPAVIEAGTTYVLEADLTLSSGQQIETLAGVLDGQGHTITLADRPLANTVTGTIQNLGVLSSQTLSLSGYSGSMAVTLSGTIQSCYSLVNMTTSGWDDIGGLVGTLSGGKICNSYYAGTNSAMFADGLVGYASGGELAYNCYTVGFSAIGMGGSSATQTSNVKKSSAQMMQSDAVELLNTNIENTGYIWAQDTAAVNGGYPILVEVTGDTEVNKDALNAQIAGAKELAESGYTAETWAALNAALENAETVAAKDDATQAEVNSALSALETAINALEKKKPVVPVSQAGYSTVKHITTQFELEQIGSGNANTYYILDQDITLDGWYMSFGTFEGVFDGNGHTIRFNNDFTGLFQTIGGNGVVQNVHFAGTVKDYGAAATEVQGAVINCYSEVSGIGCGFAKRLNGGILSNCYSVSEAAGGAVIGQTTTVSGGTYTGTLNHVYWRNDLAQPVSLDELTVLGNTGALSGATMKTLDFVALLNENRGENGTAWGQSGSGYPYFGENQTYTPEDESEVTLTENKTAIAFTPEYASDATVIENQDLQIDLNLAAANGIVGTFSLPEYTLADGESIAWSIEQLSVPGMAMIGSEAGNLLVEKEGVLVVTATSSINGVVACTKVTIASYTITAIKLYLAEYDDMENGTEIVDGKATVSGSEYMRIIVKAQYDNEPVYQNVPNPNVFNISMSDPDGVVKYTEGTSVFRFAQPGSAVMTVTYKDNPVVTATVELTSEYVAVESVVPGLSGTVVLHGRNANSSNEADFLPDYSGVVVFPENASYAGVYTITSSDPAIAEYVTSMVYGYVPYQAGTVTYTAAIDDNGRMVSGTSEVTYVYKNPLTRVSVENSSITVAVGEKAPAGLVFEGTLTDGHEVTETGMVWSYSDEGIISISRESGAFKRDETAPDDGCYFLSSEYTIHALAEGTVTVTGTPVDTTGGAEAVTFTVTVTVTQGDAEVADIDGIIADGIESATDYLMSQLEKAPEVTYGYEWYIVALLRAGVEINDAYLDEYYASVTEEAQSWKETVKPTDVERTALALAAMGKDITDVGGVNLAELIYNHDGLADGSNELAYALLALDAKNTVIPDDAKWSREAMVEALLGFQNETTGAFGLYDSSTPSLDMTAMCLQALMPYQNDETVSAAMDQALAYLRSVLSGDYDYDGNANSTAQVLLTVAVLGMDVTDAAEGFGNDYSNLITGLEGYRNAGGDGYLYTKDGKVNTMATVQTLQAYDAYRKAHKEGISYWDFTAVSSGGGSGNTPGTGDSDSGVDGSIDAYVTIAVAGDPVMAQQKVVVTDINSNGKFDVDDALYAAHAAGYAGGAAAGYASYTSSWGLSISMLWGDTSGCFGYWLNNASCWSLEDEVKAGDHLVAFVYQDQMYWSDSYTKFESFDYAVEAGAALTVKLEKAGYDENWNTVFAAYAGAGVTVYDAAMNAVKATVTDHGDGTYTVVLNAAGTYYLVASGSEETIVPAVAAVSVTAKTSESGGATGTPETGDASSVLIPAAAMAMALAGMVVLSRRKRRS